MEVAGIVTDCLALKDYQDCWLLHVLLSKVPCLSLQSECIILKDRKLNIAPAIKKQVSDARLSVNWLCDLISVNIMVIWRNLANHLLSFYCSHSAKHMKPHHLPLFTATLSSIRMVCRTLFTMEWHISQLHLPTMPPPAPLPQQVILLACTRVSVTVPSCSDRCGRHFRAVSVIWLLFVPATYVPPPATPTHSPGAAAAYPVIYPCAAPPTMYVTPQQFQYQPMPVSLCYVNLVVWHVLLKSIIRLGTEPQIT